MSKSTRTDEKYSNVKGQMLVEQYRDNLLEYTGFYTFDNLNLIVQTEKNSCDHDHKKIYSLFNFYVELLLYSLQISSLTKHWMTCK
jgi:hypothetical protein